MHIRVPVFLAQTFRQTSPRRILKHVINHAKLASRFSSSSLFTMRGEANRKCRDRRPFRWTCMAIENEETVHQNILAISSILINVQRLFLVAVFSYRPISLSLSLSSLRNTGYAESHNPLATIILTFSPRKQTDSRDTVSRRLGLDKQSGLSAI